MMESAEGIEGLATDQFSTVAKSSPSDSEPISDNLVTPGPVRRLYRLNLNGAPWNPDVLREVMTLASSEGEFQVVRATPAPTASPLSGSFIVDVDLLVPEGFGLQPGQPLGPFLVETEIARPQIATPAQPAPPRGQRPSGSPRLKAGPSGFHTARPALWCETNPVGPIAAAMRSPGARQLPPSLKRAYEKAKRPSPILPSSVAITSPTYPYLRLPESRWPSEWPSSTHSIIQSCATGSPFTRISTTPRRTLTHGQTRRRSFRPVTAPEPPPAKALTARGFDLRPPTAPEALPAHSPRFQRGRGMRHPRGGSTPRGTRHLGHQENHLWQVNVHPVVSKRASDLADSPSSVSELNEGFSPNRSNTLSPLLEHSCVEEEETHRSELDIGHSAPEVAAPIWLGPLHILPSPGGAEAEIPQLEMQARRCARRGDLPGELSCLQRLLARYNEAAVDQLRRGGGRSRPPPVCLEEALRMLRRAEAIQGLPSADAGRRTYESFGSDRLVTWMLLASFLRHAGRAEQAAEYAEVAVRRGEPLAASPELYAAALGNYSCIQAEQGDWRGGLQAALRALDILAGLASDSPSLKTEHRWCYCKAVAHHNAATALCGLEVEAATGRNDPQGDVFRSAVCSHRHDAVATARTLGESHTLHRRLVAAQSLTVNVKRVPPTERGSQLAGTPAGLPPLLSEG